MDLVPVWKDRRDSELPVDQGDVDFFNPGTKLCQINKSVSSSRENRDDRAVLLAKCSSAKLWRYVIASIHPMYTKTASARLRSPSKQTGKGFNSRPNSLN